MEEITKVIHEFILSEFLPGEDAGELRNDTPLLTGGILDSITVLKLVAFLEDRFQITIDAYDAGSGDFDTIGQIARLVGGKLVSA
jgi:acyl carrier protein